MKTCALLAAALLAAALLGGAGCGGGAAEPEGMLPDLPAAARVTLAGGRNRIVCRWSGMPQEVSALRLRVGDETTPRDIPVGSGSGERELDGIGEGSWAVDIRCIASEGKSLYAVSTPTVDVYGDRYEASLRNRTVVETSFRGATAEVVLGAECPEGLVVQEFSYVSAVGVPRTRSYAAQRDGTEQRVAFDDAGSDLSYRCVYRPTPACEDLFYAPATVIANSSRVDSPQPNAMGEGYRGIWFSIGQAASEYGPKYSGGLGTYTMKHIPMAVYAPAVERTYFVYGGAPDTGRKYLQCMIGCYDHRTGLLQRPRVVHDKGVDGVSDPHDDPTVQVDRDGYIWVFVAGRANKRPGIRYRSVNPYDLTAFERIDEDIMAYPQVLYHPEKGFFLFFTRYDGVRQLFWQTSRDGTIWTPYRQLASVKEGSERKSGHYQISNICGTKVCTAFNRHIDGNVDTRTNIYYLQSEDWGETWTTAGGAEVTVPVTDRYSNCLVFDFQSRGRNCYIKDLNFDVAGNPVILCLTSDNHLTGPDGGTREWYAFHWTGREWRQSLIATSTHCYDSGSLWIEGAAWTVIAPTDPGPQYWGAGGEIVVWRSYDEGADWHRAGTLTSNSIYNHTYVRRPFGAAPGFYAFWADGSPDARTASHLYFCTASGSVFRMPYTMDGEWQKPDPVKH